MSANLRLKSRPDRIFISVDESTGRSTVSFMPATAGEPLQYDDDKTGARALREARALSESYPGATVSGPHYHGPRPPRARPRPRKPPAK